MASKLIACVLSMFRRTSLIVAAALLCACSESVNLQTGLNDVDANDIVTVLSRNGVGAQKYQAKEGVTVKVSSTDLAHATRILRTAGLPRPSTSSLGKVFKKDGMISTPLEERVRYIYGLSEELAYTLQQFDHVVSARVHVVLPERVAPGEPVQPSSAAVFVKYLPPLDEDTIKPRIRNLVASSIPGLSGEEGREKVSVVLVPGEPDDMPIQWKTFGPITVRGDSAGLLVGMLVGSTILLAVVLLAIMVAIALRHPKSAAWLHEQLAALPVLQKALFARAEPPTAAEKPSAQVG